MDDDAGADAPWTTADLDDTLTNLNGLVAHSDDRISALRFGLLALISALEDAMGPALRSTVLSLFTDEIDRLNRNDRVMEDSPHWSDIDRARSAEEIEELNELRTDIVMLK